MLRQFLSNTDHSEDPLFRKQVPVPKDSRFFRITELSGIRPIIPFQT